ncbi:GumC family protein [Pseudobowmanella zhangzhouensis]|uniref:GumC family protein n=1 Tax=Pseudobowmanella zhangzhouensis TaxID=1537679 RepID=A0ABW1XGY8_9ALTE
MRNALLLNLAMVIAGAWRRRYALVLPILLMPILGAVASLFAPKSYETSTTILIEEAARHNPFLEDMTVATNLKKRMTAVNALLHSNHILTDVAQRTGLIKEGMEDRAIREALNHLSKSLQADLVGEDLIKLTYKAPHPDGMAELLQLVSLRFVERIIAPQRTTIFRSEEFLKKELADRLALLQEAETQVATYKSEHLNELPNLFSNNIQRLSDLKELRATRMRELSSARATQEGLRQQLSQTNPIVGKIEESIVTVLSDLAILRSRYTDEHSRIQALLHRLDTLQAERAKLVADNGSLQNTDIESLWNLISSQAISPDDSTHTLLISQLQTLQNNINQVNGLGREVESLDREILALETSMSSVSVHEQRLTELERDLAINRKIYNELQERYQKAKVTGALGRWEENERVKLIDPPSTPTVPTNLPLALFIIAGLAGGIVLGAGIALCLELLDSTIRYRRTVEQQLQLPVIARVPLITPANASPTYSPQQEHISV